MNQTELMQALRKELGREPVSPMIHRAIVSACGQLPERRGRRPLRVLDWAPRAATGLLCVLALFGFGAMLALNLNAPENDLNLPGAASSALSSKEIKSELEAATSKIESEISQLQAFLSEQELKAAASKQLEKAVSFQYSFPLRAEDLLASLSAPETAGWSEMFDWGAVQQEAEARQLDYSLIYDRKAASTMQFYSMAQINDAVSAALRDEEVLTVDGDVMGFSLDSVEQRSETSCRADHHETVWRAALYKRNVGFHVVLTFERRAACTELVLEDGLWKVGEDLTETSEPYRSDSGWYSENKGVFPTVEEALCYLRDLDLDLQNPFGEDGPQSTPREERSETEQALMKGLELEGTYGMAFTPETLLESLRDKPGTHLSELWDWDALREQRRQAAPDYGAYYEESLAKEYLERYYKGIENDSMDNAVPLEHGQTALELLSETDAGPQRELEVSYVDWNTTLSYEDGLYYFNVFYWKYHDVYALEQDENGQWKYRGLHERLEEPEHDAFQQFGSSSSAAEALEFAKRFDPAVWNPFQ